jgi:hypothetical protein
MGVVGDGVRHAALGRRIPDTIAMKGFEISEIDCGQFDEVASPAVSAKLVLDARLGHYSKRAWTLFKKRDVSSNSRTYSSKMLRESSR